MHLALGRIIVDDVGYFSFSLLPYMEQDNLYKFAGNRAAGGAGELAALDVCFSRLLKRGWAPANFFHNQIPLTPVYG